MKLPTNPRDTFLLGSLALLGLVGMYVFVLAVSRHRPILAAIAMTSVVGFHILVNKIFGVNFLGTGPNNK